MTLMRNQVLKPCTIIPPELYVEREADRQLSRILNDMGRPGYVLVARQMGKTNLLLNAKRSLAGGPDAFVYVDVSNVVPDLRSFFRSIIDLCIDSYPEIFEDAALDIASRRADARDLLEHKEHEVELRMLLKAFDGRLIVCLDEIDALTKTAYSDQVFSLIRSIYFSGRTNFPEFSRLTYILSGVAEPTEIIKNRSISPFNIGEKIYLDDFSFLEFGQFLEKAQLSVPDDVSRRLYEWTGGNPRISWDVCAALESSDSHYSTELVDQLVDKLYLRAFDLPPVDHIRTLVQTDKEVRHAVMSIHYGKADAVSDAIKGRLYLAGITAMGTPSQGPKIKNKVIEAALSEKWLAEIERGEQSAQDYADGLFREERYVDALAAYAQLEASGGPISDHDFFNFQKGSCLYYTGDYAGAIETLANFPKSRSVDFYVASRTRIGNAQLLLGLFNQSVATLEKLLSEFGSEESDQPLAFYQAKLNLSSAYLALDPPNIERATSLCESVIAISDGKLGNENLERYRCFAHYNLFVAATKSGQRHLARQAIEDALRQSSRGAHATLLLERARLLDAGSAQVDGLIECAEYCIANDVAIASASRVERPLSFSTDRAATLILELELAGTPRTATTLKRFLNFCLEPRINHEASVHSLVLLAASYAFSQRRTALAIQLYSEGAKLGRGLQGEDHWTLLGLNLALCPPQELPLFADAYADAIVNHGRKPAGLATRSTYRLIRYLVASKRYLEADQLLWSLGIPEFSLPESVGDLQELINAFLRLSTDIALGRNANSRQNARQLFDALSAYSGPPSDYYPEDFHRHLMSQVMLMSPEEFALKQALRLAPKIGRNEQVQVRLEDGSHQVGKFKKFESLIKNGKATLIDPR